MAPAESSKVALALVGFAFPAQRVAAIFSLLGRDEPSPRKISLDQESSTNARWRTRPAAPGSEHPHEADERV
jgi:hypothetical protein